MLAYSLKLLESQGFQTKKCDIWATLELIEQIMLTRVLNLGARNSSADDNRNHTANKTTT